MEFLKIKSCVIFAVIVTLLVLLSTPATAQTLPGEIRANVSNAWLGITMEDVTAENMARYKLAGEQGVIVRSVVSGGPAEKAKLQVDDVLLEYGGHKVWSTFQFSRMVQETPVGRTVKLLVSRNGKTVTIEATLGKREVTQAERRMETLPEELFGPDGIWGFRDRILPQPKRETPSAGRQQRIGITLQPLTEQLGEFLGVPGKKGALVASVEAGSPGDGKLKSGDVIVEVEGKAITNSDELIEAVGGKSTGQISMKIIRDKKETTVVIELSPGKSESEYRL